MADAMELTNPDQVTIKKINDITRRRALGTNDEHARALDNIGGIAVTYRVRGINIGSASDLASSLAVAINQGTLMNSLIDNGFYGVSITQSPNVIRDFSPTKRPTHSPSINAAPPLPSFGPNGIVIKVMQQAVRNATIVVIFPPRGVQDYTAGQIYCAAFKQGTVPTSTGRTDINNNVPIHICSFCNLSTL